MATPLLLLPPNSPFSKDIFKRIRPRIPRHAWPPETIRVHFEPGPDGAFLAATVEGLPADYAKLAAAIIREAGTALVMDSPMALLTLGVVQARRRRDAALYASLPLLFAVPILGHFDRTLMQPAILLFGLDLVGLIAFHLILAGRRARLAASSFLADIPVPGLRIPANLT
jgi:hypothetical protein